MLLIAPHVSIDESEFTFTFMTAPGPGGQNVNKLATAVQLRFNVLASPSLPEAVRHRLITLLGKKISADGDWIIKASRFRSQERNKQDAIERLIEIVARVATPLKKRKKTKPTKASVERRLSAKKKQSGKKSLRLSARKQSVQHDHK